MLNGAQGRVPAAIRAPRDQGGSCRGLEQGVFPMLCPIRLRTCERICRSGMISLSLILAPATGLAGIEILFNQTYQAVIDVGTYGGAVQSDLDTNPDGLVHLADDFQLTGPAILTTIRWTGIYAPGLTPPAMDHFTVQIYSHDPTPPGNPVLDPDLLDLNVGNSVNRASLGFYPSSTLEVFDYSITLDPGLSLQGGTTYWLSVVNNTTDDADDNWRWAKNFDSSRFRTRVPFKPPIWTVVAGTGGGHFQLEGEFLPDDDGDSVPNEGDNYPDNFNPFQDDSDSDGAGDICDPCPTDDADACDPADVSATEVDAAAGGTATSADGMLSLEFGPGDLPGDETIVVEFTGSDIPGEFDLTSGPALGRLLAAYEISPDGLVFDMPVLLTLVVDVSSLNQSQRDHLDVYLKSALGDYGPIGGASCEVVEDPPATFTATCTAMIAHLSEYAMGAPRDSDGDGVLDDFDDEMDNCPDHFNPDQGDYNTDGLGDACDPNYIHVNGFEGESAPESLLLELWWDTPGDIDQTDEGPEAGADVDLHLLHPDAVDWFDTMWVCYWLNSNPDWGVATDPSDDPVLTRDDVDGMGPETIEFTGLESEVVYRVGANYFEDNFFGPSTPTVRVYWKGELVHELTGGAMVGTGYFWQAVDIERVGGNLSVTDIDIVTSTPP